MLLLYLKAQMSGNYLSTIEYNFFEQELFYAMTQSRVVYLLILTGGLCDTLDRLGENRLVLPDTLRTIEPLAVSNLVGEANCCRFVRREFV